MPALMSSVDGSLRGISGADAIRLWSRLSKYERNCSRISSVVIAMARESRRGSAAYW